MSYESVKCARCGAASDKFEVTEAGGGFTWPTGWACKDDREGDKWTRRYLCPDCSPDDGLHFDEAAALPLHHPFPFKCCGNCKYAYELTSKINPWHCDHPSGGKRIAISDAPPTRQLACCEKWAMFRIGE